MASDEIKIRAVRTPQLPIGNHDQNTGGRSELVCQFLGSPSVGGGNAPTLDSQFEGFWRHLHDDFSPIAIAMM